MTPTLKFRFALGLAATLAVQSAFAWPDLILVKTGPAQTAPGDVITYSLNYTNLGHVKSTKVVLKDFLPSNVSVITNTLTGGSISGSTISWNIGTLNVGSRGSKSFQVRVKTSAPSNSNITNRAQIFGVEAEETGRTNDNVSKVVTKVLNRAPAARNDSYSTLEDTVLTVASPGVLSNDSDPDGNTLTSIPVSGATHGSVTLNANGSFTYKPATNFVGADSFTYKASDGATNSGVATVNITVTPVNDAPVAANDNYTTPEDTALSVVAPGVLSNDSDADGDVLKTDFVAGPAHGTVVLNTNGNFTYTPASDFTGLDSFTYRATDGQAFSSVATVTITVTPINDPPAAANDNYTTVEDTALNVAAPGVLANDTDPDGDALHSILVSGPQHGTLTLKTNGSFSYMPATNYHGGDSFTYRASDGFANSGIASVNITVSPANDAPEPRDDNYTTLEDTPLTVAAPGVLENDFDTDGDSLSSRLSTNALHGNVILNLNGSFTYTPATNYNGPDRFVYFASDGTVVRTAAVNITVISVNDAPSFTKGPNQLVQQNAGPRTIAAWAKNISAGPADEAAQTVSFHRVNTSNTLFSAQPAIAPNGTLTFTPAPNAYGVATVTVTAQDNGGTANGGVDTSAPQTFTITVNAPPEVSIASPTNTSVFIAPANFTVLAKADDPDGTIASVDIFSGTNLLGTSTSEPYFVLMTNVAAGTYTFTAIATDDLGATNVSAPVTVSVIPRPPLTFLTSVYYNPQNDFFEQRVRVHNPTYSEFKAVRIYVCNLTNTPAITVHNCSGFSNDIPYVQTHAAIPPESFVDLTIEYYSPLRIMPHPTLLAELVAPAANSETFFGEQQRVNRGRLFANQTFMVEFLALANRLYAVQYSSDLTHWFTAQPTIRGEGEWVQWIDNGQPKTLSAPRSAPARFYRVILLP